MNTPAMENLLRFRGRLEHCGPAVTTTLFLVLVAIVIIAMNLTHQAPPSPGKMLPGLDPFNWVSATAAIGLLFALILPEIIRFWTETLSWTNIGINVLEVIRWTLTWFLWVIAYLMVVFIYANVIWLMSVL